MSDELGEIKRRAAERRDELGFGLNGFQVERQEWLSTAADLDRAIAIAEEAQQIAQENYDTFMETRDALKRERELADHADRKWNSLLMKVENERQEARAAVLVLRDANHAINGLVKAQVKAMAETESYEEYR